MKVKTVVLLGVALLCGLVAMLGVQQVMSSPKEQSETEVTIVKVLVATADVEPFTPLTEENTEFKEMSTKEAPEGAVTSMEEYEKRFLRYGISKEGVIRVVDLTDKDPKASKHIPDGMRVATVKVNQTKTHSGMIRPGDSVDIALTYRIEDRQGKNQQRIKTILQNITVFATGNVLRSSAENNEDTESVKNISFLVTPQDSQKLILAENTGQLTMSLRKPGEPVIENLTAITESVFGEDGTETNTTPVSNNDPITIPTISTVEEEQDEENTWRITFIEGTEERVVEIDLSENAGLNRSTVAPKKSATKKKAAVLPPILSVP